MKTAVQIAQELETRKPIDNTNVMYDETWEDYMRGGRMTLDEAIKHAEEVAEEKDMLCKRYDDASGYSRSHNEAIRTTDAKKCEKCAEEHRQLAEWLKDYKRLKEQEPFINKYSQKVRDKNV